MQDQNDRNGAAHRALTIGTDALQVLPIKGGQRSTYWHLVIETESGVVAEVRNNARLKGWQSESANLTQFGIDTIGDQNDILIALESRKNAIEVIEKTLVEDLGFKWMGVLA